MQLETMQHPVTRPLSRRLRGITTLMTIMLLTAVLAACGGSTGQGGQQSVTIGYIDNGAEPEVIAVVKDYFSQQMHTNVQVKYFDSGPASLSAVASGAVQIMTGIGNPPVVSAISKGVPLQAIWAQELYTGGEGLVVRESAGIHSVKDLKGKNIALVLGSTSEFALDALLTKSGVDPNSVHKLNTAPPAIHSAWENKSIDAAYVWNPVLDAIHQDGGTLLATDADVKQEAPVYSLSVVNSDWAKNNAALVKGFIQAQNQAVDYYKQHTDDALQVIAKREGISVAVAKTELDGLQIFSLQDQLGLDALGQGNQIASALVAKSFALSAAFMKSIGTLANPPTNLASYVNSTYAQQLLQK
jgi:taurine ABC transporter substrate-binding protein